MIAAIFGGILFGPAGIIFVALLWWWNYWK